MVDNDFTHEVEPLLSRAGGGYHGARELAECGESVLGVSEASVRENNRAGGGGCEGHEMKHAIKFTKGLADMEARLGRISNRSFGYTQMVYVTSESRDPALRTLSRSRR